MTREIKFRAWNPSNKHMELPDICEDLDDYIEGMICRSGGINCLMQFTGIKDKNDTDIYEGDIVAACCDFGISCDWNDEHNTDLFEVKFINGCFVLDNDSRDYISFWNRIGNYNIMVVGNIHQDPEFLGD